MTIKNINKKIIRLLAVEFIQLSMPVIGNIIAQNCIYDLPAALAVRNYYYSFLVSIILILVNQIPQGILYQIYLVFILVFSQILAERIEVSEHRANYRQEVPCYSPHWAVWWDMIIFSVLLLFLYETFLAFRYIHPMEDKSKPLCNQSLNSGKTG